MLIDILSKLGCRDEAIGIDISERERISWIGLELVRPHSAQEHVGQQAVPQPVHFESRLVTTGGEQVRSPPELRGIVDLVSHVFLDPANEGIITDSFGRAGVEDDDTLKGRDSDEVLKNTRVRNDRGRIIFWIRIAV